MKRFLPVLTILFLSLVASGSVVIHVRGRGFQQPASGYSYWTPPTNYLVVRLDANDTNNVSTMMDCGPYKIVLTNQPNMATGAAWSQWTNQEGRVDMWNHMDGSDDCFVGPDHDPMDLVTNFFISFWYRWDVQGTYYDSIFYKQQRTAGGNGWFRISQDNNTTNMVVFLIDWNNDSYYDSFYGVLLADGQWHHVAMQFRGDQAIRTNRLVVYRDTIQCPINTSVGLGVGGRTPASSQTFRIGTGAGHTWDGSIDNFFMYCGVTNAAYDFATVQQFYMYTCPTNDLTQKVSP